ncbi:MAG: hypothetical protein Ct9H300mP21_06010 [Pseudomonadota bacterium]|nr:MAG: hypothetical protein Ct9H300mP21_06010 [Pseudomonadota bacterium]
MIVEYGSVFITLAVVLGLFMTGGNLGLMMLQTQWVHP